MMGIKKHTPGPWEVVTDNHYHTLIRSPLDAGNMTPGYFAEVRRFTLDESAYSYLPRDVLIANAQLIAAAPDLLAACQVALEWTALDGDGISEPVLAQIKRAVKKATS
jgi:hypothetical protein